MDQPTMAQLRTLIASERTFLTWIRMGLPVVGGGSAGVKPVPFTNPNHIWAAHVFRTEPNYLGLHYPGFGLSGLQAFRRDTRPYGRRPSDSGIIL